MRLETRPRQRTALFVCCSLPLRCFELACLLPSPTCPHRVVGPLLPLRSAVVTCLLAPTGKTKSVSSSKSWARALDLQAQQSALDSSQIKPKALIQAKLSHLIQLNSRYLNSQALD